MKSRHTLSLQDTMRVSDLLDSRTYNAATHTKNYTDTMIECLREKQLDHIILLHNSVVNVVANGVYSLNMNIDGTANINFSSEENDQVNYFVFAGRYAKKRRKYQLLMMSVIQALPRDDELFVLFPDIITVDFTTDTNNEGRPLVIMVGNDYIGEMFVFLPNQQTCSFCWVFSVALPTIFFLLFYTELI